MLASATRIGPYGSRDTEYASELQYTARAELEETRVRAARIIMTGLVMLHVNILLRAAVSLILGTNYCGA